MLSSHFDRGQIEDQLRRAIWDFEPRIIRSTLEIRAEHEAGTDSLEIYIEGNLRVRPVPLRVILKATVDLESGHVSAK